MEKLLITRADTLIGANAALLWADRMDVVGRQDVEYARRNSTPEAIVEAIRRERPHCVLHAGPTSWAGWDVVGTDGVRVASRFNLQAETEFVAAVAAACRETSARFVFVTTDAVFSGPRMFHGEDGRSFAATPYAKAARSLEETLRSTDALLLRGHVYGWMPTGGPTNYAERMLHSLTAELPYYVDVRRNASPIFAADFVRLAYEAYRAGLTGMYHLTGAERTTPHRFAAELAATLGVPGCNVRLEAPDGPTRRSYFDETSLNVGALRERLKRPLPMLREGLASFVETAFNGYRERLDATIAAGFVAVAETAAPLARQAA